MPGLLGAAIPICGVAGDQQAATVGPGLFRARHDEVDLWHRLLRAAEHGRALPWSSQNRLLTTVAYQLNGKRTYALEGRDLHRRRSGADGCATG